ncbi:hypothetical protein C8R47DRAFT_1227716 [Mycena vitilis]|nr:hypothetical protein C8R47DRAFT_1227716 [Mycena vitilis]
MPSTAISFSGATTGLPPSIVLLFRFPPESYAKVIPTHCQGFLNLTHDIRKIWRIDGIDMLQFSWGLLTSGVKRLPDTA